MEQQQISTTDSPDSSQWIDYYKQGKQLTTLGEYQEARKSFEQALLLIQPQQNEQIYVQYGHLLMLMKETEIAKEVLKKAVQMEGKENEYNKYFELAQLSEGHESLELYLKGIIIVEKEILKKEQVNILDQNEDIERLKQDICDAYGAIAELYMSDLEGENNAQMKCLEFIQKGIDINPRAVDCNLQLGNYYLRIGEDALAKNAIQIVVEEITKSENESNLGCDYGIEFLIKVAQVAIEIKQFEWAVNILKIVVDKDVKDIEGLYLMAFSQFQIGNLDNCNDFLEELNKYDLSIDEEIEQAAKELKQELQTKQNEVMGDESNDDDKDDNEWMDIE